MKKVCAKHAVKCKLHITEVMNDKSKEWNEFFDRMFNETKKIILDQYKLEEDGSGPPETIAVREAANSFPCPVRIAEIKIDTEKHAHIADEICQIVRYDFSELDVSSGVVEYYGVVDAKGSGKLREILAESFDLKVNMFEDFYRDFKTTGWYDDEKQFYTQFPLYNIKNNLGKFVSDFVSFGFDLFLSRKIHQKFMKGVDWNIRFNLKSDPILPLSEIMKMNKTLSFFFPFSKGAGIEQLQEHISNMQLIHCVPEDVRKVFRYAKDLYIYGFFCYHFFTIAQHYAYLALESAIKNRYYQSFGKEATLTNKKGETVKMGRVDHQRIIDFCHGRKGWDVHRLKIDGEKFAYNSRELLEWLTEKGIITKWERKRCQVGIRSRNLGSHLTRVPIFPPGYSVQALEFVRDIINQLYSQ